MSGCGPSVLGLYGQQHSVPWALAEECYLPGPGMIDELGAGDTVEGALFPKCHSHDSLTSESFPFLLSFSPSLHSSSFGFPSLFSFSQSTQSPQRAGDALQPPVSCEAGSQLLVQVLGHLPWRCAGKPGPAGRLLSVSRACN